MQERENSKSVILLKKQKLAIWWLVKEKKNSATLASIRFSADGENKRLQDGKIPLSYISNIAVMCDD